MRHYAIAGIGSAILEGRRREGEFAALCSYADLSVPKIRADLVAAHVNRGDFGSALRIFQGFKAEDSPEIRQQSFLSVVDSLLVTRRLDELGELTDRVEPTLPSSLGTQQLFREIRVKSLLLRIASADRAKDEKKALALIDELETKYPDHPTSKNAGRMREQVRGASHDRGR